MAAIKVKVTMPPSMAANGKFEIVEFRNLALAKAFLKKMREAGIHARKID